MCNHTRQKEAVSEPSLGVSCKKQQRGRKGKGQNEKKKIQSLTETYGQDFPSPAAAGVPRDIFSGPAGPEKRGIEKKK